MSKDTQKNNENDVLRQRKPDVQPKSSTPAPSGFATPPALPSLHVSRETHIAMLQRLGPAQQQAMALELGRTRGNQYVSRLVADLQGSQSTETTSPSATIAPRVQAKLTVNEPGDVFEQEADATAE